MAKANKVKDPNKLGLGRLLAWKSSDIGAAGIQAIVLSYLTIYCTDTLGLNPAVLGTILMVSKLIDGAVDIFYAWLVDNTNTKLGKGRPYELAFFGMTLSTILLFSASPEWDLVMRYVWVTSMYILVFAVFQSLRVTGQTAYTIRAFNNNDTLLTKVASYGGIVTMLGSIVISMTFPMVMAKLATSAKGWTTTVAIYMIPLTIIGSLRFLLVKEDQSVDSGKSYEKISIKDIFTMFSKNKYVWFYAGMMMFFNVSTSLGAGSYYFKWIVGNPGLQGVTSATSFLLVPVMLLFPVIIRKLGSVAKMVTLLSFISVGGYLIVFIGGGNLITTVGGMVVAGLVTLPMSYFQMLFVTRCATYNEVLGMQRMECSSNTISIFASNIGGALGSFISGILLSLASYNYGEAVTVQSDSALFMIRCLYSIVPAILVIGCGLCAWKFTGLEKLLDEREAKKSAQAEAQA